MLFDLNRNSVFAAALAAAALIWGCSGRTPAPGTKNAEAAPAISPPTAKSKAIDDAIQPLLRTPWKGDLDEIARRRVVRVLVPFRRPEFFYMGGRPVGILQEVFQELERLINAKYKTTGANRIAFGLIPTPQEKLRERMVAGLGDIAAYGIPITEKNRQFVDFTTSTIAGLKIIAVTGPGAPKLERVEDLSGKEVWVNFESRMKTDIDTLNARLRSQGKAPAIVKAIDPALEPGDVMEMVNVGTYPIALMQSIYAEFWAQVFDRVTLRTEIAVADDVELGWGIQKGTPKLKEFLDDFIRTHRVTTAYGDILIQRYLKEAQYISNARETSEMKKFQVAAPLFRKYAAEYGFDYLLLAAQGYQESGLDQKAKSPVGAIGVMQVMPRTAASAPVNIPNVTDEDNNIHAGVRMIHFLIDNHFNEPGLDQFNRTLFAIAAYNAGPAKIARCRQLAKDMGYDSNKWFGNVEVAVAKVIGHETTEYVGHVLKYYITFRLAMNMKSKHAAPRRRM